MVRNRSLLCSLSLLFALLTGLTGCSVGEENMEQDRNGDVVSSAAEENTISVTPSAEIMELEDGFSVVRHDGDDGFDGFLSQGGASSDGEVVAYLAENLLSGLDLGDILGGVFGCSTIASENQAGEKLFGRNFDWENCEAMIVASYPENGYASLSTVNMDFITQNVSGVVSMALRADEVKTLAALYAPLDGINEAGLAVSVNMIQDSSTIDQDTGKPDLTTTTAIRLLLNQAADVDEALELLNQYDMHASMGMMVHFALADISGRSVAVEYVDNQMVVIETPVLTNFYLAEGEKQGIGTQQSHERYEILMDRLEESETMEMPDMRDALDSVSKDNFEEFASTEWSAVFNLDTGEVRYYHRENYKTCYQLQLEKQRKGE